MNLINPLFLSLTKLMMSHDTWPCFSSLLAIFWFLSTLLMNLYSVFFCHLHLTPEASIRLCRLSLRSGSLMTCLILSNQLTLVLLTSIYTTLTKNSPGFLRDSSVFSFHTYLVTPLADYNLFTWELNSLKHIFPPFVFSSYGVDPGGTSLWDLISPSVLPNFSFLNEALFPSYPE